MHVRRRTGVIVAALAAAAPASAAAEPAVGVIASGDAIVHFDTASPATIAGLLRVTGLASPSERIVGVDYRHQTAAGGTGPGLYALTADLAGVSLRLYRLDPGTGVAAAVGAPVGVAVPGQRWGFDFNPAADRLRVVNENGENLRLNPDTGALAGDDTNLTPGGVAVTGVAYDRAATKPTTGPTTLFAIDNAAGTLGRIGGVDGTPSPNGGVFSSVGPLGVAPDAGSATDLDVSVGASGDALYAPTPPAAYATIVSGGQQRLYGLDLATGAATAIDVTGVRLAGLAVLPTTSAGFGQPFISSSPATLPPTIVKESAGSVSLPVVRDGDLSSTLPIDWRTTDGQWGTLVLAPGEASKGITISVSPARNEYVGPVRYEQVLLRSTGVLFRGSHTSAEFRITKEPVAPWTAPAPDTARPTISLSGLPGSITYRKLTTGKGLRFKAGAAEPVSLEVALLGTPRGGLRLTATTATLAERALPRAGVARTISLKPRTKDFKRPTRTVKLKVRVRAWDAAGNRATLTRTITVKPR